MGSNRGLSGGDFNVHDKTFFVHIHNGPSGDKAMLWALMTR